MLPPAKQDKVSSMELKLFGPVPTEMLVEVYGTTLAKVREGDTDKSTQLRLSRLKAELGKLGVPVKSLPGIMLSPEKEADLYKRFADCYKTCVRNMTWSEIMMNHVKLSEYGFTDAASLIRDEVMRRGHMEESDEETVVDSLCRLTELRIAAGAT